MKLWITRSNLASSVKCELFNTKEKCSTKRIMKSAASANKSGRIVRRDVNDLRYNSYSNVLDIFNVKWSKGKIMIEIKLKLKYYIIIGLIGFLLSAIGIVLNLLFPDSPCGGALCVLGIPVFIGDLITFLILVTETEEF